MSTWIDQPRPGLAEGAMEDIGTLARQLHAARDSMAVTGGRCAELSERLLALQEVVLTCGGNEALLRACLSAGDPDLVLAVAIVALKTPEAGAVLGDALAAMPPAWWPMFMDHAFIHRRALRVRLPAVSSAQNPSAWLLARLGEFQAGVTPGQSQVTSAVFRALSDPLPAIRCLAWQIIGRRGEQLDDNAARRGIQDGEAIVRQACAETLVWIRHPLFARLLGEAFKRRAITDHEMLLQWGRLVPNESVGLLLSVNVPPEQGLARVALLSAISLPSVVPELVRWMESRNPAIAVAAGQAFYHLTGKQIDSAQRVVLSPESSASAQEADAIDVELQPTAWLPDHQRAKAVWAEQFSKIEPARRLSAGITVQDESAVEDSRIATAAQRSAMMRRTYFHGQPRPRNR